MDKLPHPNEIIRDTLEKEKPGALSVLAMWGIVNALKAAGYSITPAAAPSPVGEGGSKGREALDEIMDLCMGAQMVSDPGKLALGYLRIAAIVSGISGATGGEGAGPGADADLEMPSLETIDAASRPLREARMALLRALGALDYGHVGTGKDAATVALNRVYQAITLEAHLRSPLPSQGEGPSPAAPGGEKGGATAPDSDRREG